jgi:hypothetical protein
MQLEVTLQEAVFITNVIGELPSKTGASALYENLKRQVEAAQQPPAPPTE